MEHLATTDGTNTVPYRLRKGEELPEGALFITPAIACKLHQERIKNWKPKYEVWPFSYGNIILMGTTALSASIIHLKWIPIIGTVPKLASLLAVNISPSAASMFFQQYYVRNEILKGNVRCNICTETRSGVIQAVFGCAVPLVLSTLFKMFEPRSYNIIDFVVDQFKTKTAFKRMLGSAVLFHYSLGMIVASQQISVFNSVLLKEDLASRPATEFD